MKKKKTISLFLTLALIFTTVLAVPSMSYASINIPVNGAQYELGDSVEIKYGIDYFDTYNTTYCDIKVTDSEGKQVHSKSIFYNDSNRPNNYLYTSFTPSKTGTYTITQESYIYREIPVDLISIPPKYITQKSVKETSTSTFEVIKKQLVKQANPLKIKAKTATVKYSKLKKKNQTLAVGKVMTFTKKGQGKISYAKASGNKKITINKNTGKVTVKKGLKKNTYKVKVKVKAAGNTKYKPVTKSVTFKIKVK